MKKAIVIAVGQYQDPNLDPVEFAANDAHGMSTVLETLGFDKANQQVLIDTQATGGRIRSRLDRVIESLEPDDVLHIFYAGRGFSQSGRNFLTCHDTDCSDWDGTSISLEPYLEKLQKSPCKKLLLFLDCRESGIAAKAGMRGIYDNFNEHGLEQFFAGNANFVCFAACKQGESSSSSKQLKHGIWAYHLLEALKGEAPLPLRRKRLLAPDLQNHLADWVPRTVRVTYADGRQQTPWVCGGVSSEFEIADLTPILEARASAANPGGKLTEVSFVGEDTLSVSSLKQFNRKRHTVPDSYNSSAATWVAGLANEEVGKDLDQVFDELVDAFGYARADLTTAGPEDGAGSILTPTFKYTIAANLNPEDPREVKIERRVHEIADPHVVESTEFERLFGNVFDTLEFALPWTTKIQHIVDTIESMKNPKVAVKFDRGLTYCDIELAGVSAKIHVRGNTVSLIHGTTVKPVTLVESLKTLSRGCVIHNLPLLR